MKKLYCLMFLALACLEVSPQSRVANDILNIVDNIIAGMRQPPPAQQPTVLNLYNNTGKDIYFAVAFYDYNNQCWSSKGWYFVSAYKDRNLNFGGYTGKVYVHGYRKALWGLSEVDWGSGYSFCIDHDNAFEIRNADKITCNKKGGFSEFSLSPGINKWSFNP